MNLASMYIVYNRSNDSRMVMQHLLVFFVAVLYGLNDIPSKASENIDTESCLALNDAYGSDFDWSVVNSNEDLEACLLALAKKLQSKEAMIRWLRTQGFSNVHAYPTGVDRNEIIWAEWSVEQSGSPMPFKPDWSLPKVWFMKRYTYAVSVSYNGELAQSANAIHQTK